MKSKVKVMKWPLNKQIILEPVLVKRNTCIINLNKTSHGKNIS